MAYKALYRKFRPRRFSDLKGQDMIATVLKNQVKAGEPAHAYLFSGPRGTGKTSTAKILATALNCLNPVDGEPCLKCENCRAALNDSMIDIIEMDAASNNGVDNARDIRDKAGLLPAKGKYKIYIIDEVHMLTGQAFNALLKTLEEPPEHVVFILATTELDALPKTVLSRCLRFDFQFIDCGRIVERMKEVLEQIGAQAEEKALEEIAEASEGAMRDALTILEKCCAFGVKIDCEIVASVLGRANKEVMQNWMQAMVGYDEQQALLRLRQILDSGVESSAAVEQILQIYEQMLFSKICKENNEWSVFGEDISNETIIRGIEIFSKAQVDMRFALKPDIVLEAAILRALLPISEDTRDQTLWREEVERLEKKLESLKKNLINNQVEEQVFTDKKIKRGSINSEEKQISLNKQPQTEVMENSEEDQEIYWSYLKKGYTEDPGAQPMLHGLKWIREDANTIYLQAANSVVRMMIENSARKKELQEKMDAQFGRHKNIQVSLSEKMQKLPGEGIIDIID